MKSETPSGRLFRLPPEIPVQPYKFQLAGVLRIEDHNGRMLLSDDAGLGKTLQVLLWLYNRPDIEHCLVVCPASIKWQWQSEAWRFCKISCEILGSRKPPDDYYPRERISIINYDVLKDWLPTLEQWNFGLVVFDECHAVANLGAKRTKAARRLGRQTKHILALSATPLTNRPAELFSILNILWPEKFGNFMSFATRYTQPQRSSWGWVFNGSARLAELHARMWDCGFLRRRKEQVLDQLPPKIRSVVPVDITNRLEYEKAEKDFIRWIIEHRPDKISAAARGRALFQMTALLGLIGVGKIRAIKEWIDNLLMDTGDKLIFFAKHSIVLETLQQTYPEQSLLINGKVIGQERQRRFDRFRDDDKIRLLFGGLRSAGAGSNAQVASYVGFGEMDWTPGVHVQCEGRAHRIGSKKTVNAVYLIGKNTLEERVCRLVQNKAKILDAVLDNQTSSSTLNVFDQFCEEIRNGN